MAIVIIQKLVTSWTKESRGEPGAARRNATPIALPVPGIPPGAEGIVLHTVSFDERDAFEATPESRVVAFEEYPRDVPELMLRRSRGTLSVRYIWAYPLGAPDRPRGGVTHLKPGHWCRLLHNGRVAYDGGWSYESTVLNIANGPIGRSLFTETDPLVIDDQRAELR